MGILTRLLALLCELASFFRIRVSNNRDAERLARNAAEREIRDRSRLPPR